MKRKRQQGAESGADGVDYRIWAPDHADLWVSIGFPNEIRRLPMARADHGYHSVTDPDGGVGDWYRYALSDGRLLPDPASRFQPEGVHGPSQVVAPPDRIEASEEPPIPAQADWVICEVHVGAFTPEGSFRAAAEKLPQLAAAGINAVQLMPLADFPGERNWGYDGVAPYAPSRAYGTPEDLRFLIRRAHQLGMAMVLDVVYNHLGPDGNYLGSYAKAYFNKRHRTPWGDGFNFDGQQSRAVRDFFLDNLIYWREEFGFDGFRLDATHAILDDSEEHFLAEAARRVHEVGAVIIAEDERNLARLIEDVQAGGLGMDGVWADDFHHSVRVAVTGEAESYLADFDGGNAELVSILNHGWLYRGQKTRRSGEPRGTECGHLPPERFVVCISNHDQTGNRAFGERLHHVVDAAKYRAATGLLLLSPYLPLLFMGQEWGTSSPFLYFTDHHEELGRLVTKGRRREFREWKAFADAAARRRIPDPQAVSTFQKSKLDWAEAWCDAGRRLRAFHGELIRLRSGAVHRGARMRGRWKAFEMGASGVGLEFVGDAENWWVMAFLNPGPEGDVWEWPGKTTRRRLLLSSNEERFGGAGALDISAEKFMVRQPELLCVSYE